MDGYGSLPDIAEGRLYRNNMTSGLEIGDNLITLAEGIAIEQNLIFSKCFDVKRTKSAAGVALTIA